jgi:hypothetical protein
VSNLDSDARYEMVCSLLHFFRFVAVPGTLFVDISSLARAIVAVSFLVFLQIGMLLFMVAICMRTIREEI